MAINTSQFREFRFGWPVVLASTFGISLGMSPLPFYTIGVFAQPLAEEFGWGIDQIMFGLVPFCIVTVISAPMAGYLSDRFGVRRVALISMVTFSLGMMLFALNNGSQTLYLFLWGLLSALSAGTLPITFTKGDFSLVSGETRPCTGYCTGWHGYRWCGGQVDRRRTDQ
jgi:MFS family permease